MEVSLMIGAHADEEGAYLSLFAAIQQLEKSNLTWEIVMVFDGGTPAKYEKAHPNIRVLRYGGGNRLGSPQATRDAGIRACQYRNVLCIDSHVIISDIEKWVLEHERLNAAISFPGMVGTSLEMFRIFGGNKMDWEGSFWNVLTYPEPPNQKYESFMVCQCAHSAFIVDRNWYLQDGGYTMEQKGYGGEEVWLALLAWMMGREVWFIPQVNHAHFMPASRNEGAGQKDDFARNFLLCAYVFGGQKYLDIVKNSFAWAKPLVINPEIARLREKICKGPFRGDLDLLRAYFNQNGVVN